jgi:hypothetical protein
MARVEGADDRPASRKLRPLVGVKGSYMKMA